MPAAACWPGSRTGVGLTGVLSAAMGSTRQRRSAHNPGVVLRDLVVMLADGGGCLADLGAVCDQVDLYGHVASDSTAFRVIDSIDEQRLDGLRGAVAVSRARARAAWRAARAVCREMAQSLGADGAGYRRDAHDRALRPISVGSAQGLAHRNAVKCGLAIRPGSRKAPQIRGLPSG